MKGILKLLTFSIESLSDFFTVSSLRVLELRIESFEINENRELAFECLVLTESCDCIWFIKIIYKHECHLNDK